MFALRCDGLMWLLKLCLRRLNCLQGIDQPTPTSRTRQASRTCSHDYVVAVLHCTATLLQSCNATQAHCHTAGQPAIPRRFLSPLPASTPVEHVGHLLAALLRFSNTNVQIIEFLNDRFAMAGERSHPFRTYPKPHPQPP